MPVDFANTAEDTGLPAGSADRVFAVIARTPVTGASP
jgi:hypothetical protein